MRAPLVLVLISSLASFDVSIAPSASAGDWREKVAPSLLRAAEAGGETEFLVLFAEQPDLTPTRAIRAKQAKGRYVMRRLTEAADRSQAGLMAELAGKVSVLQRFWLVNMVRVRGDMAALRLAAERSEVVRILSNPSVRFDGPVGEAIDSPESTTAVEWGVNMIEAPAFWTAGFTGQNVVVAGQDTGYRWTHNAIKGKYRGWNGATANHDYNWHDAITAATNAGTGSGGGGACGLSAVAPCDDNGHGTHTMGTMVGDDGGTNQVGVAPGAKWIGCRNMNVGFGSPATYIDCFQFFVAPTNLAGASPDPSKAPHVINNSWGCDASEGCSDVTPLLQQAVEAARAAGILVVVSAGNSGSGCSTVSNPAAIYQAAFSVGSTTSTNAISSFSSRGPVTFDGSNRMKPNVSAPGSSIRSASSSSDVAYATFSGTSMAGPHVAGLSALLMSRASWLIGHPHLLETHMERSSAPFTSVQTCGGVPGTARPNNTFGFGRVRAVVPVAEGVVIDFDNNGTSEAVIYRNGAWLYFPIPIP